MISKTVCFLRTWLVVTGRIGPASLNVDNAMEIDTETMREYKGAARWVSQYNSKESHNHGQ
jgi:hypothetical protein